MNCEQYNTFFFITLPPVVVQSIAITASVCLSVCLSVSARYSHKLHIQISQKCYTNTQISQTVNKYSHIWIFRCSPTCIQCTGQKKITYKTFEK